MKLNNLRPKHFVISFLYILNPYGLTISPFSLVFSQICIALYFMQLFSYIFKLEGLDYSDSKVIIFSNLSFYSNYVNILAFLQSDIFTYIVYFMAFAFIFLFYCYWTIITIALFKKKTWILNITAMIFLHRGFSSLLSLYYWVLMTPILELFINIINKGWFSFLQNQDFPTLTYFISSFGLVLAIVLSFFLFWLNRNNTFLDKDFLRLSPSFFLFLVLIIRIFLIVGFNYIQNGSFDNLIYIVLLAIGVLRFIDYYVNFSIIHESLSKIYILLLSLFIFFTAFFTYFVLNNLIIDSTNLYELAFISILIGKIAMKLHERLYNSILANSKECSRTINFIEELFRFYQNKRFNARNSFFFSGILGSHLQDCSFKECPLKSQKTEFAWLFPEAQEIMMKRLLNELFMNNIRTKSSNANKKDLIFLEALLIKYVSFSANFNFTLLKSFFEIQNILTMNKNSRSFYFQSITYGVLKGIQQELIIEAQENNEFRTDSKEIPLKAFFKMLKEKSMLQRKLSKLLVKKHAFWEKYKEGFQSYEAVIKQSYGLIDEIINYKEILNQGLKLIGKVSNQNLIFLLKFHSIFSCVILNNINEGVQFEDRLEKIMKRELTLEKNILNCHSFFNEKLVIVQSSFLKLDGKLLDSCKTTKLAGFFKYSLEDLKNIKNIKTFMPKFINEIHNDIVANYINDNKDKKRRKTIESFAIDKEGCLFPTKIYLSQNFQKLDDLVFEAALLNVGYESEQICVLDKDGFLLGMTRGFLDILQGVQILQNALEANDLIDEMNFFCLLIGLEDIFKENIDSNDKVKGNNNRIKNTILRNLNCVMKIPVNFNVIIEILREKVKEEQIEKSHHSSRSIKSNKSNKSKGSVNNNSKSSRFLSLFFSTMGNINSSAKTEMEQKFLKKQLSSIDVLKKIIDNQKCLCFRVFFNLNFSVIKFKNQELIYVSLTIYKIMKFDESLFNNNEVFDQGSEGLREDPLENQMVFSKKFTLSVNKSASNFEEEKSNGLSEQMKNMVLKDNQKAPMILSPSIDKEGLTSSIKYEDEFNNNRLFTTEADQDQALISEVKNFNSLEAPRTLKGETVELSERLRQISKKHSVSDSIESEELKKCQPEQNKIRTSLEKIYNVVDRSSQASSLSSLKKTFSIFNMIRLIQGVLPNNIRTFGILQIIEFLMVLIYCVFIYNSCLLYMSNYYNPLQDSLSNYANICDSYSIANSFILDLAFMRRGVLNQSTFSLYQNLYKTVLDDTFQDIQNRLDSESQKNIQFFYQTMILDDYLQIADFDKNDVEYLLFNDFLEKVNTFIYQIKEDDLTIVDYEKVYYISVNYILFNNFYSNVSSEIEAEFINYNDDIAQQVESLMISFFCLIFLIKVLQTCQLYILTRKFMKLLNIFLRINENEAFNEAILNKQIGDSLEDPYDKFLNLNYPEKVLNRKTVVLQGPEEQQLNNSLHKQKSLKNKKKKADSITSNKFSLHNIRPISKTPIILYIFLTFALMFAYLFFNYYFSEVTTRQQVETLINVASFFENFFTAPATIFLTPNILYYDKLYGFQLYPTDQADFQSNASDLIWGNEQDCATINEQIPELAYTQAQSLQTDLVTSLISGNICDSLRSYGYFTDDQEFNLCEINYNEAFQKGIVNVIAMVINDMNNEQQMLSIDPNIDNSTQQQEIINFLQTSGWNNSKSLTNYFYNKATKVVFDQLNDYYRGQINNQLTILEQVLLSTSILMMFLMLILIYYGQKILSKIYKNITILLNLIPFEKLINDEQTSFLIKTVIRE